MSDNVPVTPGIGATIATDQVGSAHHQIVKLADGTADSATRIAADVGVKANALRVAPANDIPDGTYIGKAGAVGDVASDSVDAGNPVKIGGKAVNMDGTAPGTAVAENDRADCRTDVYGRLLVETEHPNFWTATADYSSAQTNTELKATPGAGLSLYVTDIIISNGAVAGSVKIVESTGASPVDKVSRIWLAINSTVVLRFVTPIKLTANKNAGVTSVTVTYHTVTMNGYIAP
jgi:hypothetical protein